MTSEEWKEKPQPVSPASTEHEPRGGGIRVVSKIPLSHRFPLERNCGGGADRLNLNRKIFMTGNLERWLGCYGGVRGDLFDPESNQHPAKMSVALCYKIFDHGFQRDYWKPKDTILDPMAGIGTTLIVGLSLGYNVVGVELEERFVRLAWANYIQATARLGPQNIKGFFALAIGDARRLREILKKTDQQLTSQSNFRSRLRPNMPAASHCPHDRYYIDAVLFSPPFMANNQAAQIARLELHPENLWCEPPRTYLSAMLAVYRDLHAVLKPDGVACLVTKNQIKSGKIRWFDEDTIRLMERAGFLLIERKRALLSEEPGEQLTLGGGTQRIRSEHKSFFKRIFERKRTDLRVDYEDVLFFRRIEK